MKRMLLETFLGLLLFALGIFVGFKYLTGIDAGISPWFLVLAIFLVGCGAFFLLHAGKVNIYRDNAKASQSIVDGEKHEGRMEKNSKLLAEWNKTEEEKEKLRMLSLRAEAEEKTSG